MTAPPPNHHDATIESIAQDVLRSISKSDSDSERFRDQPTSLDEEPSEEIVLKQPFYVYNPSTGWDAVDPQTNLDNSGIGATSSSTGGLHADATATRPSEPPQVAPLTLVTWNVDFMEPHQSTRLTAILAYIQRTLIDPLPLPAPSSSPPPPPPLVLLQEVHHTCFPALLAHPLLRAAYALSDTSPATWSEPDAAYGLVTLVPRTLAPAVHRVFRTPFASEMAREALFVDINIGAGAAGGGERVVRVANTHLESLRGDADAMRPFQLAGVARRLAAAGVHAGVVAGDMNPIGPRDQGLPARLGLVDAWVAQRDKWGCDGASAQDAQEEVERDAGEEGSQDGDDVLQDPEGGEGYTWGTQPPSRFPRRRMDKILFTGGVDVDRVERIGIGLKVAVSHSSGREKQMWASDHFGLVARVVVGDRQ